MLMVVLLNACATTSVVEHPIRVVGTGSTFDEAKNIGFRKAIEFRIGTMVLSERETNNLKLVRDQLFVYSSGYVDDFKIIDTISVGNQLKVVMDVYVSSSKLSERLLSPQGTKSTFNGTKHDVQYTTFIEERKNADKLVDTILKDYPKRAYKLEQLPYNIAIDGYRNIYINVLYNLYWDYNYLKTLNNVLSVVSDNKSRTRTASVFIASKAPGNFIGNGNTYYFDDLTIFYKLQNYFYVENEVRLKMLIKDYNHNIIHESCWAPGFLMEHASKFYSTESKKLSITGNGTLDYGYLQLKVQENTVLYNRLKDIRSIELTVKANKDC